MKKFLTLGLAAVMAISFAACNTNNGDVTTTETEEPSTVMEEVTGNEVETTVAENGEETTVAENGEENTTAAIEELTAIAE